MTREDYTRMFGGRIADLPLYEWQGKPVVFVKDAAQHFGVSEAAICRHINKEMVEGLNYVRVKGEVVYELGAKNANRRLTWYPFTYLIFLSGFRKLETRIRAQGKLTNTPTAHVGNSLKKACSVPEKECTKIDMDRYKQIRRLKLQLNVICELVTIRLGFGFVPHGHREELVKRLELRILDVAMSILANMYKIRATK